MTWLALGVSLIVGAGAVAWATERRPQMADRLFRWGMLAGCLSGVGAVLPFLARGAGPNTLQDASAPFGLDPLSAWFALIILGMGAGLAVYGTHYMAAERPARRVGSAHFLLALLIAALTGVVTARNITAFLVSWEVMAVAAWLLVIFEREHAEVRRAGFVYLVLTHLSTLALFGMFAAWSGGSASASFDMLASASARNAAPVGLVLLLGLTGFGIKAGVVPGHVWLPGAHAAAPSHVSALLSGVMLKVGIYGLFRILLLSGAPPAWFGWVVLLLGLTSAVLGVLWALAQHDLKRLLAYHSVENIGIILIGLGLGALGSAYHYPTIALVGYTGALLHCLNHSLFKGLLFLGAGVILRVAGTREIDRLGGLVRVMPRSTWAFLLGSVAIVGLPPLNGFVSEWMVFSGLLQAGGAAGGLRTVTVVAAGLALTGGLALACFSKIGGVMFLGTPRHTPIMHPEAERGLVGPQLALALGCAGVGSLSCLVIPVVGRVGAGVLGAEAPLPDVLADITASASGISFAALSVVLLVALIWWLRAAAPSASRSSATWGCGFPDVTGRMQYTAASYAGSLLTAFGRISGVRRESGPNRIALRAADPVFDTIARPAWGRFAGTVQSLRRVQSARLSWYLVYVIAALLGLLIYLWFGAGQ